MKLAMPVTLFLIAACGGIDTNSISTPPPGKVGFLDNNNDSITLSLGTAMAFDCEEWKPDGYSGPCRVDTYQNEKDDIIGIYTAATAELKPSRDGDGDSAGDRPRAIFVITGKRQGSSEIVVKTQDHEIDLTVQVVP